MTKYLYFHKRLNGTRTDYVNRVCDLGGDNEAVHIGIEIARQIVADGLTGTLFCEGSGTSYGHDFSIPLDNIDSVADPLAYLPKDEILGGYGEASAVIAELWPGEGEPRIMQPLTIPISFGVRVAYSRPQGNLISLTRGDKKVDVYHQGPSLYSLMLNLGLTEAEARQVWTEACLKIVEVKKILS